MAGYSYKFVRDKIPEYIKESIEDYEGDPGYDGDMWIAVDDYIEALEVELAKQYAITKTMANDKLLAWLRNRPKTLYVKGPVIWRD